MFSFRKKSQQARRKSPKTPEKSFEWRSSYNWIFLLIPLTASGWYLAQIEAILPIRTIQLAGSFENLDQSEVEQTLRPYIGQGFFSLDIHEMQQQLHRKPWTDSVSVRRIWPDKLRVTITEKKPVARWDKGHLLSSRAKVYAAEVEAFGHLPVVHAVNHDPDWVMRQFYRLEARFAAVDEDLVAMRVDSRGAIDIELINGLQIKLGRSSVEHKVDRLISIYQQQILPRREQIDRLDLRYANGFAVAWKKEALQGNDKASLWSNSNV